MGLTIGGIASPVSEATQGCRRVYDRRDRCPFIRRVDINATRIHMQTYDFGRALASQFVATSVTMALLIVAVQRLSMAATGRSNWSLPQVDAKASCGATERSGGK